jgi:hypothetical protein
VSEKNVPASAAAEPEIPGLKIFAREPHLARQQQSQLALMDQAHGTEEKNAAAAADADASKPQAMIDKLRSDLEAESKAKKGKEPAKKSEKKKTHGSKKTKGPKTSVLKRPAAAPPALKRPASAGLFLQEPDPKRAALLKMIPSDLLDRYAGGCSRCYHRKFCTVSCWARRGYKL